MLAVAGVLCSTSKDISVNEYFTAEEMCTLDLGWFLTLHPDTRPSCKRYRDSIGYLLGKASLFITGAVLWRMKMVLGKGLESNQRGHCCVVGGERERSDIWIGDGGGEEEGLFAQPAAEDMVVISHAHIFYFVVTWVAKFGHNS